MLIETIAAAPQTNNEAAVPREHLRTFHLAGPAPGEAIPEGALHPTLLDQFVGFPALETYYPLCVHPDGNARSFREMVNELEHAQIITSAFFAAMNGKTSVPLQDAAPAAIASLKECSSLEISRLRKLLPAGAFLLNFHADSLVLLHAAALAEAHRAPRTAFWDDVRRTTARLREMLLVDRTHLPGAISSQSVTASLGARVSAFFNPGLLAKALQRQANPLQSMEPARRSRCEATLNILEEALHDAANDPAFFLFHSGKPRVDVAAFRGAVLSADDGFAAARELCETQLGRLARVLRALRLAKLENDSAYDPSIHDEMLARFNWQSAGVGELMALPPIVAFETADRLAHTSLSSFGRLLGSGRPVQILIARAGLEAGDLSGFSPDFGYLAIAHRESFVLQSSMSRPSHLLPGLAAMAKTQRPAVAVISVPVEPDGWLCESLLVLARTHALYTYDPDAGPRWSERFKLFVPAPSDLSPTHAAAVAGRFRKHFRVIPVSAWNSDQMELPEYLAAYKTRAPLAIPYIWVQGEHQTQARALLTRDLVNLCVDRSRAWMLFEELSGLGQPKVVPNDHAREEGARNALQQVIAMLQSV